MIAINDYTHTLNLAELGLVQRCKEILAAWRVTDLSGRRTGFLLCLKDGRFAYATGSCGPTGWGDNDSSCVTYFDRCPDVGTLDKPQEARWIAPPDQLHDWIARGSCDPYDFD